jgi:ergothioneine biosynthesis protein EgtB
MNLRVDQDLGDALRVQLSSEFSAVRAHSHVLSSRLSAEDHGLQSMPDTSPTKWHLAHTTWFFEVLVLCALVRSYRPFDPRLFELFNSYYEALGPRHPRPQRGVLSRPSLAEIWVYRHHVEQAMGEFFKTASSAELAHAAPLITLGLHHEQQHQELLLTDILHAFSCNPLRPVYSPAAVPVHSSALPLDWIDFAGGLAEFGHCGEDFAFDNETPRHRVWLEPFQLASRPVTCGEYLAFIRDGGYRRPEFWLSDGWACVQAQRWEAPLYWLNTPPEYQQFTLHGTVALDLQAPVCHVSYYEAAAYAAWAGARLPSEFEWERAASECLRAERRSQRRLHPVLAASDSAQFHALFSEVWQWTHSAYAPYPGFRPLSGAAAEYNGKFMVNQLILRGGSCATPPGHLRHTYRNFFPPTARWQFSGLRLARDSA